MDRVGFSTMGDYKDGLTPEQGAPKMSGETTKTYYIPAARLAELYELKTLSPVDVVKEALARIANIDGHVNA